MNQTNAIGEVNRLFTLVGAWSAFVYVLAAMVGWWIMAGYWPMLGPSESAETVGAFYNNGHLLGKRLGLIVLMWAAIPMLLFTAAVAHQLSRIEGRSGPLTYLMLLGGFATAMLTFYPALWWLAAAFRPDTRAVELTYLLNDVGWLQFVGGVSLAETMYIAVAVASFVDKSAQPIFPRWSGFASLWVLVLLMPGQLLFLFKTGPFAWNGLFGFWIPGGAFLGWFFVIGTLMIKYQNRQRQVAVATADTATQSVPG